MKPEDIKIKWTRIYMDHVPMYLIDEIHKIDPPPQIPEPDRALRPQAAVVIENTKSHFIVIFLAKSSDGLLYSSSKVFSTTGSSGSHPSPRREPGQKTVREALRFQLNKLRNFRKYANDSTEWINRIVDRALQEINKGSLQQMSIFDML